MFSTTMPSTNSRLVFADVLRVTAILAVISIHVHTYIFFSITEEVQYPWWISNILFTSTKWAVPVFVMLSGAFLLNNKKKFTAKEYFRKRILKLLVPLLTWTIICKGMSLLFFPVNYSGINNLALHLLKNTTLTYHLWFLYMLIGLYLLSPILKDFIKNEPKAIKYFLGLSFIANVVLMVAIYFKIERVVYNPFYYFSGFVIYFVAGYYLCFKKIPKLIEGLLYVGGCISWIIGIFGNYLLKGVGGEKWDIFIDNLSPFMILISIAVFLLFKRIFTNYTISPKAQNIIQLLSSHCYGIYLIHTIILSFVGHFIGLKADTINVFFGIPFTTISVFLISLVAVVLIKNLRGFKWMLP